MFMPTSTQLECGYHPCMIWDDWFHEEPEGGSNPKKRLPSTASHRNAYKGKKQP